MAGNKPGRKPGGNHGYAKAGPKPGKLGERIKKRMEVFDGFPLSSPVPQTSSEFYDKAEKIFNQQLTKLSAKSNGSYLDINEVKIVMEMIRGKLILDSKQKDLTPDTSDESVEAALNLLTNKKSIKQEQKENPDESNTEDVKTAETE